MAAIPGLENINFLGAVYKFMYWFVYAAFGGALLAVLYMVFRYFTFDYSVTVFKVVGSGTKGVWTLDKPSKNRVRLSKDKTYWNKMMPMFNSDKVEPFPPQFIYPGKRIFAFEIDKHWSPADVNIHSVKKVAEEADEHGVTKYKEVVDGSIDMVQNSSLQWLAATYKENEAEYAKHNFWEDNKEYIVMLVTIIACVVLVCFTVWFTYKFALGDFKSASQTFTQALKGFGGIPAK